MAFRFRQRVKILPGIYLNIGKTGVSTTIGPKGANINIGKTGVYLNTGIPGTGISNREKLIGFNDKKNFINPNVKTEQQFSTETNSIENEQEFFTSEGLLGLKEHLEEAQKERKLYADEIKQTSEELAQMKADLSSKQNNFFSKIFSNKDDLAKLQNEIDETTEYLAEIKKAYEDSKADINIQFDSEFEEQFKKVYSLFGQLIKSNKIWVVTSEDSNYEMKSAAATLVDKTEVTFQLVNVDFIKSSFSAFHLKTVNGSKLLIFPAFILLIDKFGNINIIDLKEIDFNFHEQRFIESQNTIPTDSKIIDYVWYKLNKDGSPDLRFKGNYQIPVVKYGTFNIYSINGLNETFQVSNVEITAKFAKAFDEFLSSLKFQFKLSSQYDPLLMNAAVIVVDFKTVSTANIQKALNVDSIRAENIMHQLEEIGVVSDLSQTNDRAVLVKDVNSLAPYFMNLSSSKINTSTSQSQSNYIFTKKYYDLLLDFSKQVSIITNKLATDSILIERFKDKIGKTSANDFIVFCVFLDFCQILKILCNYKIDANSLETFGLFLLSSKISTSNNYEDYLKWDFLELSNLFLHHNENYADEILEFSKKENPLQISIDYSSNEKITSSKKLESNLALPTALKLIDHPLFDEYSTTLFRFANIIAKADNIITKDEEKSLKDIYQITHHPIPEEHIKSLNISNVDSKESLDDVLNELDNLCGLDLVKQDVNSLINFIKIQEERKKMDLKSTPVSYHCVFTGSPGTGKTTVARIVAKIYKHLGILKKGHLVETDRSGLIAEYTGQTAIKVNKVIDSALDGVLFIDEAYSLVGESKDDFGKEAVATLIKRMEDERDKLVVIIAGYTDEMNSFIETNPGFKSRFNRYIEFADYTPIDLLEMFNIQCKKLDYILSLEARLRIREVLQKAYDNKDKTFGNGRFVRNIFEKTLEKQANRIASVSSLTKEILITITLDDIPS